MARFLPLIVFVAVCFWLISRISGLPRGARTYRPRPRWQDWGGGVQKSVKPGTVHIVRHGELAGLRDAYSSAPIDPAQSVFRCGKCLSVYHASSIAVLQRENGGCCMVCGGTDIGPVRFADA
jgi:hypothetical protein